MTNTTELPLANNVPADLEEGGADDSTTQKTGWFDIQEGEQTLDIPASFGPNYVLARIAKLCVTGWAISTLVLSWLSERDYPAFWLAYLTHWGCIFTCFYQLTSLFNSLFPPAQPTDTPSFRIKFSWLLFELTAMVTLVVTALYWGMVYDPTTMVAATYLNLCVHLFNFVSVWFVGLLVDRTPVRWSHMPVPMVFAACYLCWLVIHQMATDIGVPESDSDLIYAPVDFENKPVFCTILSLAVVFVAVPLGYSLLWALSRVSFCPCGFQGRRYLLQQVQHDDTIPHDKEATDDDLTESSQAPSNHSVDVRIDV